MDVSEQWTKGINKQQCLSHGSGRTILMVNFESIVICRALCALDCNHWSKSVVFCLLVEGYSEEKLAAYLDKGQPDSVQPRAVKG